VDVPAGTFTTAFVVSYQWTDTALRGGVRANRREEDIGGVNLALNVSPVWDVGQLYLGDQEIYS
jgi:hypothetical protein